MKPLLPNLIPWPSSLQLFNGSFLLSPSTRVIANVRVEEAKSTVETCLEQLNAASGFSIRAEFGNDSSSERLSSNAQFRNNVSLIEFILEVDDDLANILKDDLAAGKRFVQQEAYSLKINPERVTIRAIHGPGLYYGCQTFRQLLPPEAFSSTSTRERPSSFWRAPVVNILDKPRFEYRGMMLDVGRHFMPKAFVKKMIDVMSAHKLNRFHWHLTEDQGWRIEIKKYPKLTKFGSYRRHTLKNHAGWPEHQWKFDGIPHEGFYTQEEVKEVVGFAAKRHIVIIPEIEMPGHSQAAISAYPELGNRQELLDSIERKGGQLPENFPVELEVHGAWGVNPNVYNVKDSTLEFLKNVLIEVMELFPSELIHIGGDECPKLQWKFAESAQERIAEFDLKDESELQSWFIGQINEFLLSRGRRVVGWDEILEGGLAREATVMSWRGLEGAFNASKMGHKVIATPTHHTYFDYYQSRDIFDEAFVRIGGQLPLEKVYEFEVVPANFTTEMGQNVLGTQGQLWTEYMKTKDDVEWMGFPRICALAEIAWTSWKDENHRASQQLDYGSSFNHEKSFVDFERRLQHGHLDRLSAQDINFFQSKKEKDIMLMPEPDSPCEDDDSEDGAGRSCSPFYILQHLEDGLVVGKSFSTEAEARKSFEEKVCPNFAAVLLSSNGKILEFWGEPKKSVLLDFSNWLRELMASAPSASDVQRVHSEL